MTKGDKKLQQKLEQLENQLKRALADYQNLEKRVVEERREWIRTANKDLILRLLPGLDALMLAAKHVDDQGLKLSIEKFLEILKNEGVEKIETEGKVFDAQFMECIETVPGEENKVIEELRVGYKLYDNVLRPAQVKVGKENK